VEMEWEWREWEWREKGKGRGNLLQGVSGDRRPCFLLYVADVIELVKECGLIPHAFADDLQITVIVSRQTLRNWSPV